MVAEGHELLHQSSYYQSRQQLGVAWAERGIWGRAATAQETLPFVMLLLPVTALPLLLSPAWSASTPAPHYAFPAAVRCRTATHLQQNQVLLKCFTAVSWFCATIVCEAHVAKLHFATLPHLPARPAPDAHLIRSSLSCYDVMACQSGLHAERVDIWEQT